MQEPTPTETGLTFNTDFIFDTLAGIAREPPESPISSIDNNQYSTQIYQLEEQVRHLQEQITQIMAINQLQNERIAHQDKKTAHQTKELSRMKRRLKLVENFLEINGNRFADIQDELGEFNIHSSRMRTLSNSKFILFKYSSSPLMKAISERNLSNKF